MMKICLITVAVLVFMSERLIFSGSVASQNQSQSIHNGISNSADAGYEITVLAQGEVYDENLFNHCRRFSIYVWECCVPKSKSVNP